MKNEKLRKHPNLSLPRRRESSQFNKLDARLRGHDDLIGVSLIISSVRKPHDTQIELPC